MFSEPPDVKTTKAAKNRSRRAKKTKVKECDVAGDASTDNLINFSTCIFVLIYLLCDELLYF